MTALGNRMVALVNSGKYIVGLHAAERLEQRGILEWQVIEAMAHPRFLLERLDESPNSVVEFELLLPDGTPIKAVWAYLRKSDVAKLVTIHYLED